MCTWVHDDGFSIQNDQIAWMNLTFVWMILYTIDSYSENDFEQWEPWNFLPNMWTIGIKIKNKKRPIIGWRKRVIVYLGLFGME